MHPLLENGIILSMGLIILLTGLFSGYILAMRSFKKGATLVDRLYQEKAPFDEDLQEVDIQSHTDGREYEE